MELSVVTRTLYISCRTKDTLAAGNYLNVISILMQLRKVYTCVIALSLC